MIRIEGEKSVMSDMIRRSMPLFPIGIVMQLTELTARQIRYYEENDLISPARTESNRRLFSFNDVDKLLEIKTLIDEGVNLAGIKKIFARNRMDEEALSSEKLQKAEKSQLSDAELRKLLKSELTHSGRFPKTTLRQGDMSRFFQ